MKKVVFEMTVQIAGKAGKRPYPGYQTTPGLVIHHTLVVDKNSADGLGAKMGRSWSVSHASSGLSVTGGRSFKTLRAGLAGVERITGEVDFTEPVPSVLARTIECEWGTRYEFQRRLHGAD
jgi:hypothetical protein